MSRSAGGGPRSLIVAAQAGVIPLLVAALLWLWLPGASLAAAQQGPPPTPVPPRGSPSPFLQELDPAGKPLKPPKTGAKAVILVDLDTGQVLYGEREDLRRPIASLTKVMTGLLTIEETDPEEIVRVSAEAAPPANLFGLSALGLQTGETISVKQLTYALLMQSANDAAVALAEHISGSVPAFQKLMNKRASQLGMTDTRFASPNGLDDDGYSSAADLAILTQAAMAEPEFARISRTKFHTIPPADKGEKPRKIQNRNVLLWLYPGADGAKTGFTSKAGYCLIATATRDGRRLVAVVLGVRGEAFSDASSLLSYGFKGFESETFTQAGEDLGTKKVGDSQVQVEARDELELLVPRKGEAVEERVVIDPDAAAGPTPVVGDVVGELRVTSGAQVLGSTPAVVTAVDGATGSTPTSGASGSQPDARVVRIATEVVAAVEREVREGGFAGVL